MCQVQIPALLARQAPGVVRHHDTCRPMLWKMAPESREWGWALCLHPFESRPHSA
jgi:hypothetical protein